VTTFDLFADPEPITTPAVAPTAPAVAPARAEGEKFMMQPTGEPNRWLYRDVLVTYDARRERTPGVGRWATVEGIGLPILHSDDRTEVCRAIDGRIAARGCP
jgi:hypothetical protein